MLGGRSNLLELWLWRLIFVGGNPCQSLELKIGLYSLQLLINASSFSFLVCYPVHSFYTFWRKGEMTEKESGKCLREKYASQSAKR